MLTGFTFNRIVIIQSLETGDAETGRALHEHITANERFVAARLPIEILNCGYAGQFLELIQKLTQEATTGNVPLLHVECHGDPKEGLEFQNGSTLHWEELASALLPLNRASRFNLLAVFSACFGAHFLGQMGAINPAPCWCLVAPTEKVSPGELMAGFRAFYSGLFNNGDMGAAVRAISKHRLSHGRWLWEPAELWFEKLVTSYVEIHCCKPAARKRAKRMYRQLKKQGEHKGIGALLRSLKRRNRSDLLGEYFDGYFMTAELPDNIQRFQNVRQRITSKLATLRSTRRYCV